MPDTWDDVISRNPELGLGDLESYGEGLPSPEDQDKVFENYLGFLSERIGDSEQFTPAFAALTWNYGARGAKEIMEAAPDDSVEDIIGSRAYEANRLSNKGVTTVQDLLDHFRVDLENSDEVVEGLGTFKTNEEGDPSDDFRSLFESLMVKGPKSGGKGSSNNSKKSKEGGK